MQRALLFFVLFACAIPRDDELGAPQKKSSPPQSVLSPVSQPNAPPGALMPTLSSHAAPAPGWHWDNPLPRGSFLYDVRGCSSKEVYAVGISGTILRSYGGAAWQELVSGSTEHLHSVACAAPGKVFAVGEKGTILFSSDFGASWSAQKSGVVEVLFSVWASGDEVYIAGTGGTLLSSHDQGKTWTRYSTEKRLYLSSIWGSPAGDIFVTGEDVILRSQDKGKTWELIRNTPRTMFGRIQGDSLGNLYVFEGKDTLLRSQDRGKTWKETKHPELRAFWVSPEGVLFASTPPHPTFYRSDDQGATWQFLDGPYLPDGKKKEDGIFWLSVASLWGESATDIYAVGAGGAIFHSVDGGKSWPLETLGARGWWRDVWVSASGKEIWVAGHEGLLLHSADGGASWEKKQREEWGDLFCVLGSESNEVYLAGSLGIFYSSDGGISFTKQRDGSTRDLWQTPDTPGALFAVGDYGVILFTKDKGKTWTQQKLDWKPTPKPLCYKHVYGDNGAVGSIPCEPTEPPPRLHAVYGVSSKELYAVGDAGLIVSTKDGGKSWQTQKSASKGSLYGVFASKGLVYVSGDNGTILTSTDQGKSWSAQESGTTNSLQAIWGAPSGEVYVVGASEVLHTLDQGKTWRQKRAPDNWESLYGVFGDATGQLWVVGQAGVILHSVP